MTDTRARAAAEEMLLDYLVKAYKITPQSWSQVKALVDAMVADAVAQAVKQENTRWRELGHQMDERVAQAVKELETTIPPPEWMTTATREELATALIHQCEANNRNWKHREQQAEEIARLRQQVINWQNDFQQACRNGEAAVAAERQWWLDRFSDDTPCATMKVPECTHRSWSECVLAVAALRAAGEWAEPPRPSDPPATAPPPVQP